MVPGSWVGNPCEPYGWASIPICIAFLWTPDHSSRIIIIVDNKATARPAPVALQQKESGNKARQTARSLFRHASRRIARRCVLTRDYLANSLSMDILHRCHSQTRLAINLPKRLADSFGSVIVFQSFLFLGASGSTTPNAGEPHFSTRIQCSKIDSLNLLLSPFRCVRFRSSSDRNMVRDFCMSDAHKAASQSK